MKSLVIPPTSETPLVDFNPESGQMKLEGRSWPENATRFYLPILEWLNKYVSCVQTETTFSVTLEYFNSTSSKVLYQIFLKLLEIADKGSKITIQWRYLSDDEEMLDVGKQYLVGIPNPSDLFQFTFVCIDESAD